MKVLGLVVALLSFAGVASACGNCLPMATDGSMLCVHMASETGCVSACDPGSVNCICADNPCIYGPPRDGGLIAVNNEDKPEPVTKLTPFKNKTLSEMAALCAVTPGCTMFSDNYEAHGPRGIVIHGPRTWGGIKAFYR